MTTNTVATDPESKIVTSDSNYQSRFSLFSLRVSKAKFDDHVRIFATLVPDEIIYRDSDGAMESNFNGVLLFVDVSGFTDLCEKYNMLGKGGPSRITLVLNSYIGAMVQEIMSHNGDIMKFSGDAFLALWKCSNDISMSDVVHSAIDCALGIQRSHGTYTTEVNVLRVKIALSAGPITFSVIGGSNFMILGSSMLEVKSLEGQCGPGDIAISATIKMFLTPNEYILDEVPNSNRIKVISIGPEWTPSTISNQFEIFDAYTVTENKKTDLDEESDIVLDDVDENRPAYYSYMLRPSLDYAANRNMNDYLKCFVIPPVVKAIDSNEPLDYLTEMRQVVIVFVNVVVLQIQSMSRITQLCNDTYEIVCDIVTRGGGCVNKVSVFDKDLMFLVIFGLRGFKHTFEAQRALYCAQNVILKLKTLELVQSASVGVCTGMTYCGVVGHPMRKEYTVIGRTVNKAARLMVAYPNMVTCDRQTFLHSQLQARYFTLQPYKYLKGFKTVGPIYKYYGKIAEDDPYQYEREMTRLNQYPMLDRQTDLEKFFYHLMMKHCDSDTSILSLKFFPVFEEEYYSMIIINGRERSGKTRFLKEILYFLGDDAVIYYLVSFSWTDNQSYKLIQKIFEEKCGLNEKDIKKRTENVLHFMSPFKVPEFLCALNDLLNVDFPVTKYYNRLTDEQKVFVKRKMLKYLCCKGIQSKSLLLIDNIEFMDGRTWSLFKALLNVPLMFVCCTMGNYGHLGDDAKKILKRPDVKIIKLEPIDKLYHSGLICQFLNVGAVSIEIERYIQEHSYGNPGWVESFLTTLADSNLVKIFRTDKYKANVMGYVIPPENMLFRYIEDKNLKSSSIRLVETKETSFTQLFNVEVEDWDIYSQTISEDPTFYKKERSPPIVVCDLNDNVALDSVETEDYQDISMIQTYDSLKVQEQLLLKCSSILGDSFSRAMLEYIMQSKSILKNAEAIQKLFQIKVFCCARAKYTKGAIQIDHYYTDPNQDPRVACYCTGFPVNPILEGLPKCANCGYIRFRNPQFRQMLIQLLTDNQANLYHVRSMWFLESQTKRCLDCGLGYFTSLIGQSNDDGMKKYSIEHIPSLVRYRSPRNSSSWNLTSRLSSEFEDVNTRSFVNRSLRDLNITRLIPPGEKTTNIGLVSEFHVRTFADNNLYNCECESILITMYTQMIEHCQEADMNEKLMCALLEYATLCIKTQNISVGFTLLEKATELLDEKLKYEYMEPNWQVPLTRGRIMLLQGQLHIERSAFNEAELCLINALKCYNLTFPQNQVSLKVKTVTNEIRQKLIVEYFPHRYIGSRNEDVCTLAEQTSDVMSSLFILYRRKLNFDKAYLASVWGMNEALRSDSNFAVMCNAYANLLTMNLIYTKLDFVAKLEDMALSMCYRKHTRLERHELEAVARLYGSIFCRKCLCDNMLESLKLGSIVVQMNSPAFGGASRWLMLPLMLQALINTYLISQAALLVQKMSYYKFSNQTHFAPMMYYSLCIEFRLYTSYGIEEFQYVESHRIVRMLKYEKKILTTIEMRYHVDLWLWYVRKQQYESAACLYHHIQTIAYWPHVMEPSMIYVFIHLLEGFLLLAVRKIDSNDYESLPKTLEHTKSLLRRMEAASENLACIRSRVLLLKAFWFMINQNSKKAFKTLDLASSFAKKCGILYDIDWIEWTRELWLSDNPKEMEELWITETDNENLNTDWEDEESNDKPIPFYSFVPPKKPLTAKQSISKL